MQLELVQKSFADPSAIGAFESKYNINKAHSDSV